MYVEHFRLRKEPFSIAPDPRFLFMSEQHREALAHLLYGVGGGGGFVLLTGEIGAGKTTVCRCFLEQIPKNCCVAYVFNPKLTVPELLQTICQEFGIAMLPEASRSVKAHVDALNSFLLKVHAGGRSAVLIIDEAQSLAPEVLEQLRLLTNLETVERKLLQIILIGQPELREMLQRPDLEQVAQRVIARYHLGALSEEETRAYVKHRLSVAGGDKSPFEREALTRLHALTGGVPRRINLLADRAMLGTYAQGRRRVDRPTLERAALEVFGRPPRARRAWPWAAGGVAALGLAAGVAWWLASAGEARVPVLAAAGAVASSAPAVAASAAMPASSSAPPSAANGATAQGAPGAGPSPAAPTAGAAVAATATADDLASLLQGASPRPGPGLADLGRAWGATLDAADACGSAAASGLACFRGRGGVAMLRQLDRPALLALRRADGEVVHAQLVALDERGATLVSGQRQWRLALPVLAAAWRGEFVTFWKPPPGWRSGEALDARARVWLDERLAAAGLGDPAASLRDRVWAFQVASGLEPDGRAGPLTLMQLARAGAVPGADARAEPRLPPRL